MEGVDPAAADGCLMRDPGGMFGADVCSWRTVAEPGEEIGWAAAEGRLPEVDCDAGCAEHRVGNPIEETSGTDASLGSDLGGEMMNAAATDITICSGSGISGKAYNTGGSPLR